MRDTAAIPNLAFAVAALFLVMTPVSLPPGPGEPVEAEPSVEVRGKPETIPEGAGFPLRIRRGGETLAYRLDGVNYSTLEALSGALREAAAAEPDAIVRVTVGRGVRFGEVRPILERIRAAGLSPLLPMEEATP